MFHKLLVGYSGSESCKAALERAVVLACEHNAEVTVLWVRKPPVTLPTELPGEYVEQEKVALEYFQELKKQVQDITERHNVDIHCVSRVGHPAKTVIEYADQNGFDLIVVGHSHSAELWGRLLGNTADRIADHAHCSVLIVKHT